MKHVLLILAMVALMGCGGSDISQCHWCKEDIKEGALICKHCGKDPSENGAGQEPDKTTGSGQNTKPPVDPWESKSHPDQVTIRELETDKQAFIGPKKMFVIKGKIKPSTWYPSDPNVLPSGQRAGRHYLDTVHYAFEINDETGRLHAYAYKELGSSIRKQLSDEPSGRLMGFFHLTLSPSFPHSDNERVFADYWAHTLAHVPDTAINQGTSSSAPSEEQPSQNTTGTQGEEPGSLEEDHLKTPKEKSKPAGQMFMQFIRDFASSNFIRVTGTLVLVLLGFPVLVMLLLDVTKDYAINDMLGLYSRTSVYTVVVCIIALINWVSFKEFGFCLGIIILLACIFIFMWNIPKFGSAFYYDWNPNSMFQQWSNGRPEWPLIYKVIGFVLFISFCAGIIFFLSKPLHRYFAITLALLTVTPP